MPYNEFSQQVETYFDIGKSKLEEGNISTARNNFNMALAIAKKEKLNNWVTLIQDTLDDL